MYAHQWRSSTAQTPSQAHVPESSGWILEDGQYKIVWFTGEVAPKVIDVTTVDEEIEEAEVDINEDEGIYYIFQSLNFSLKGKATFLKFF